MKLRRGGKLGRENRKFNPLCQFELLLNIIETPIALEHSLGCDIGQANEENRKAHRFESGEVEIDAVYVFPDSKCRKDQQPAPNHDDMFVGRLGGCDELHYENGQRGDDRYVIDDVIKWPCTNAEGSNGKRDFDDDQQVGRRRGRRGLSESLHSGSTAPEGWESSS